jgi:hypothetical protein
MRGGNVMVNSARAQLSWGTWLVPGAIAAVAAAAVLAGCASSAPQAKQTAAAAASATQSYIVYPAPGTSAVENNSICQFAHNTEIPVAKRKAANDECDQLLSRATAPVTKPAIPPIMSTPAPPFQPSAGECTSGAVRAEFRGGGYGGGNDFGGIWIWNPQSQPCTLRGQVAFAAYFADGSRDLGAVINRTVSFPATTLPANMPAPGNNTDPSGYMVAGLMGPERDDPAQPNGVCRSEDELSPATLELTLGTVSLRVRNQAANSDVTAIYGCDGQVLLEDVTGPLSS